MIRILQRFVLWRKNRCLGLGSGRGSNRLGLSGGEDLLRVKGILNVTEFDTPVIIHGVQHVFHPPVRLDVWPDDDHTTRIVFITKNIPKAGLEKSLASFCQAAGKNS